MNKIKGQIALEYLMVASFVLLMTIPLVTIFYQESIAFNNEVSLSQTNKALQKIADTANTVYYLGPPSKRTITVYFPENVKNVSIGNDSISAVLGIGNDFYLSATSDTTLNGSMSSGVGIHEITVEAKQTLVQIEE